MASLLNEGVDIHGKGSTSQETVLSKQAIEFLQGLHGEFQTRREDVLALRVNKQEAFSSGQFPRFLPETAQLRDDAWKVAAAPKDLENRRIEITGPVEAKMMINAMNCGANVFMADFEDALSPTWKMLLKGRKI